MILKLLVICMMVLILSTCVNRDSVIILYKINWFQQQVQNFGEPFFLVIHEGETLAEVKVRIQKKLQVPDEEFSKVNFFPLHALIATFNCHQKLFSYIFYNIRILLFTMGPFIQREIIFFPIILVYRLTLWSQHFNNHSSPKENRECFIKKN